MLDLQPGTLEFLILRTIAWGPQHGFGIAKWIKTTSATVAPKRLTTPSTRTAGTEEASPFIHRP